MCVCLCASQRDLNKVPKSDKRENMKGNIKIKQKKQRNTKEAQIKLGYAF